MIVDIQAGGQQPKTAFLKLFDRRFAEQHREDNGLGHWTKQIEEAYIRDVESGAINGFLHDLHSIPGYLDSTGERWNAAQNEAYLGDELFKCFQAETATYAALSSYQGHQIPHLLASVELKLTPPNAKDSDHFHIKGVLLEYIHGFSMSDMDKHAPNTAWQGLVDQALGIVRILDSHNILNRDVRPGNIMITENGGKFQVYMIDFGLCRFRGNESEQDWGRAKFNEDEEGAIGMTMRKKLQAHGFKLHFQNPDKYLKYAETG
ncbi:hypothetical protein BGW80DRAFT_1301487 [Lactifluus volemus]|nr:hypothetical protein BGW80DRAFT_1301487 [Lactifluus volemus]